MITYSPATPEDLPQVVDLCMQVEEQHETYWPQKLLQIAADWTRSHGINQLRRMVAHHNPDARRRGDVRPAGPTAKEETPLQEAARGGSEEAVKYLLSQTADVQAEDVD